MGGGASNQGGGASNQEAALATQPAKKLTAQQRKQQMIEEQEQKRRQELEREAAAKHHAEREQRKKHRMEKRQAAPLPTNNSLSRLVSTRLAAEALTPKVKRGGDLGKSSINVLRTSDDGGDSPVRAMRQVTATWDPLAGHDAALVPLSYDD
jgi:hypothetical protein